MRHVETVYSESGYAADRDRINERRRERNFTDVEYAERERERKLEWYRERSATDPEFAERSRKRQRERYATDPEYAERQREKSRARRRSVVNGAPCS